VQSGNGLQVWNAEQRMEYWAVRIKDCRSSGLSVRRWCRENEVREKTYYYWQKRIWQKAAGQQPEFAEIPNAKAADTGRAVIRLTFSGAEASIYPGADPTLVQAVIAALKPC
jgi:hypothetical protein